MPTPDHNLIELLDGIVCMVLAGDQTDDTILAIARCVWLISEDLPELKILIDARYSGKINLGARKAGLYAMKNTHFDKAAIFGASPITIKFINTLARTAGKSNIVHFTNTREKALKKLNS